MRTIEEQVAEHRRASEVVARYADELCKKIRERRAADLPVNLPQRPKTDIQFDYDQEKEGQF